MTAPRIAVGIDVGGTFTDLAALHADGTVHTSKVLSVAADRAAGVLDALRVAALNGSQIAHIAHGTTVVTNLLLERAGARVVACATAGFTDLLELRRQERAALYDLATHHPRPLVEPSQVIPVRERITPEGVAIALTELGERTGRSGHAGRGGARGEGATAGYGGDHAAARVRRCVA